MTALNTAAQLASFVLFAAIARLFGANSRTDAFFLALTIPMLLIGPVVNAVRAVFIPIIAECRARHPETQGRLIGSTLLYVLLLSIAGAALFALAAPLVLPYTATGLAPEARHLVVQLTLLLLPLVVAQALSAVVAASYNATGRFTLPAAAAGLRHIVALLVIILLSRRWGVLALPTGFVAGAAFQLGLLVLCWRQLDIRIEWTFRVVEQFRRSLRLAVPLILGTVALYLAILVTRYLASWLPPGSVTILDYASRITSAVMEVLTSGVLLVILANWSRLVQRASARMLYERLRQAVVLVMFVVMPVLAILFALRGQAVTLLLGRGEFDATLTSATASIFAVLLLGLPLDIIGRIFTRLFLVRQATWVMGTAAAVRLALVTALSLALMGRFGLHGLAAAESIGIAVVTVYFVWIASRMEPETALVRGTIVPLIRICLLAGIAGLVAGLAASLLSGQHLVLVLVLSSSAGAAVYAGVAFVAGADELRDLRSQFSRRLEPLV